MRIILLAEHDDVKTCEEFWDLICDSCNKISSNVEISIYRPHYGVLDSKLERLHRKNMKYFEAP